MKQLLRLIGVFFVCSAVGTAAFAGTETYSGKEMKQVAPAPPACDFNWTGFYAGFNAGYGWGSADTHFHPLPDAVSFNDLEPIRLGSVDPSGFIGGGQIGYNFQWNWLVLGAEGDFQGADMEGSQRSSPIIDITGAPASGGSPPIGPDSFLFAHERTQWFGTARGRIGFAPLCRLMIYGTGGLAVGNVDYSANTNYDNGVTYPVSFTKTKVGWTVGGGLEYALSHHWSLKAEYLYYDLGDESRTQVQLFNGVPQTSPTVPPVFHVRYNFETTANIVRGGLNFKF
jgi:outer membrane immunogenic protein